MSRNEELSRRILASLSAGGKLPPSSRNGQRPAFVVDAKLSRSRSAVVEMYDLQLASAVGAPAMERCLLRYIENTLGLPVWVPVELQLYVQLDKAVRVAVDDGECCAADIPPDAQSSHHLPRVQTAWGEGRWSVSRPTRRRRREARPARSAFCTTLWAPSVEVASGRHVRPVRRAATVRRRHSGRGVAVRHRPARWADVAL